MNGKGDTIRPRLVSEKEFAANWDAAFGKKICKKAKKDTSKAKRKT